MQREERQEGWLDKRGEQKKESGEIMRVLFALGGRNFSVGKQMQALMMALKCAAGKVV